MQPLLELLVLYADLHRGDDAAQGRELVGVHGAHSGTDRLRHDASRNSEGSASTYRPQRIVVRNGVGVRDARDDAFRGRQSVVPRGLGGAGERSVEAQNCEVDEGVCEDQGAVGPRRARETCVECTQPRLECCKGRCIERAVYFVRQLRPQRRRA